MAAVRGLHRVFASSRHHVLAMGLFDDIVPPDIASGGGYSPLRITVRPKGVEPPPGNAQTAAEASDGTDNAPPARTGGLFDDIVPPAGFGNAPQFAADASNETDNSLPARTAGLFDDIVPLSPQATGSIAARTEGDIPYYDPMTGMPMPAPQLPPQSPGLPVRPETQAPLNTPPSGWPDLPVTAPRFGVPLAVPDPNARGEGFPAPPGPTAMDRIKAAAAHGFGEGPLGFSEENRAKYPSTYLTWQPLAAPLDFVRRAPGAAIGAISSAGSEIYKAFGGTETNANRLERDLNILGQGAMVEGGIGGHYNVGRPRANPFRTTEGAMSDEAAANPRAGPQRPARPPDKTATQSDRMNSEARESGPFDSTRPAAGQHPASATGTKSADNGSRAVNDRAGTSNKSTEPAPVYFDPNKYPQSAGHAKDAQNGGAPDVLTVRRVGAPKRRQEALSGTEPQAGFDRDEYPPAATVEGGAGASVRLIDSSDNRGAGSSFGYQIRELPDGTRVRVIIGPKPSASERLE